MRLHYLTLLLFSVLSPTEAAVGVLDTVLDVLDSSNSWHYGVREVKDFFSKTLKQVFGDKKVEAELPTILSQNATPETKLYLFSDIARADMEANPNLRKIHEGLNGEVFNTLSGLHYNILIKKIVETMFQEKFNKSLPETLQNDSFGQTVPAKHESWGKMLLNIWNGVLGNQELIKTFQDNVLNRLGFLDDLDNVVGTFGKDVNKTIGATFSEINPSLETNAEQNQSFVSRVRNRLISVIEGTIPLKNFWQANANVDNRPLLTEVEKLFEKVLLKHLTGILFEGDKLKPPLEKSVNRLEEKMTKEYSEIAQELTEQAKQLEEFFLKENERDPRDDFMKVFFIPVDNAMRGKLRYRENRSLRLYWKQFKEKYNGRQISTLYDNMGYDYIFKTYLNRLYNHEVAKGNNTFDYRSYETFTQMYTTVYEMARQLRFFSDSQEKILESEVEEDIRVFSRYREEEMDEFKKKMEKLRKVDRSFRKKIATIDFNTFVAYQMGFCTIDLSDTTNHSLLDLGLKAFHNFVNIHRWKDTNETLNRNFLFYQNTTGSCEHRFNYIHMNYHHGHFHQKNSRTGAKFYLFREHDEITNEEREKLNTSLNESFLNLASILPKTQEAYHEAAVKICQKKVNDKHKCRFVLTTTNDCIYPRESDDPFILFLNPHKNIKVVIGI